MTPELRRRVFLVAAAAVGALLLWGLAGLPDFGTYAGPYGDVLNQVAVAERKATNVVASVTFDYRGVDTMGEEFILFAAVMGVAILLRAQRDETEQPPDEDAADRNAPATSNAVRVIGLALVGPVVLFGLYLVAHGHLTPGGGFQGGVVLATAALLVWLSGEYVTLRRVSPELVGDLAESVGAATYVVIGLLGVAAGATFLANVLPLGQPGALLSAGTIPPINAAVGLEVAGGFVLLVYEFLEQTLVIRRPGEVT
ncbi:MAG TPA: MnhB domain-containing protein [Actinomycetota bacterium]|nr:MnhB domain-containing protein [Actinomycetota bacterium]